VRFLTDTHAMLWWLRDDPRLSRRARTLFGDGSNDILWSMASSWEIALKVATGKLDLERPIARLYADLVTEQGVTVLSIGHEHCTRVAELPLRHRDPFDRMLVAQAQEERVPILTADPKIAAYGVDVIW